jgi:hypothetical protein
MPDGEMIEKRARPVADGAIQRTVRDRPDIAEGGSPGVKRAEVVPVRCSLTTLMTPAAKEAEGNASAVTDPRRCPDGC